MESAIIYATTQAGGVRSVAKKKPSAKAKKSEKPLDDAAKQVVDDFKASWDYTSTSWHQRWLDNYKLFNNQRVKIGYEGITNTFVPMVYSTVETMTAALFGTKPKFVYIPPSSKQDQKTDILNSLLDYYWDKDQWSLKIINTGRNMFNLGTGIDYFMWYIDHPVMINIPLRDFLIDPTATSIETARYCGRRYLITLDELKEYQIVDATAADGEPKLVPRFKNLDQLKDDGSDSAEKTDKQEKDELYGSTLSNAQDKQVEVIEYWTPTNTISVANRRVVIEDTENWFLARAKALGIENPKGILPFADARDVIDPSLFFAKGITDFIGDQNELLNDVTNQNIDSVTYTLNQMYTLDPKYADKISEIENIPGAVYPFEANALQPIQQRPVPAEAFNERMNIKNEIRETTASNEVVKGVGQQNSNTTATEIQAQIAGAGQRINMKVTQIENGYFYRMARIIFEMIRLYVTEPTMVRIIGKDGARWEEFDPSQFRDGEYEPRVQLDVTVKNNKQQESADAKEMLAAFLNDPDINQQELKKLVLARSFDLDPDEVGTLIMPAVPVQPQMNQVAGATPPMGGAPTQLPAGMPMSQNEPMVTPEQMAQMEGMTDEELAQLQAMTQGAPVVA